MKNGKHKVIAQIAGPGLVLAAVFALVLSGSNVGRAQASATSSAVPAAAPAKAAPATPAKRQPGGTHEGIKVHGHWTIEVREPSGKLISHTEFENSLYSSGGAALLPLLFTAAQAGGGIAYTPGEWGILLGDSQSSPCTAGMSLPFNNSSLNQNQLVLAYASGGYCSLSQFTPPAAIYPTNCSAAPNSDCSYSLQVGSNQSGLTLTGSVVSANAGTISQVQTLLSTCSEKVAPAVCATETSPDSPAFEGGDLVLAFTAATLPQSGGATPCGGANQISCAVTVPAAGDTINVSVTISFQ